MYVAFFCEACCVFAYVYVRRDLWCTRACYLMHVFCSDVVVPVFRSPVSILLISMTLWFFVRLVVFVSDLMVDSFLCSCMFYVGPWFRFRGLFALLFLVFVFLSFFSLSLSLFLSCPPSPSLSLSLFLSLSLSLSCFLSM